MDPIDIYIIRPGTLVPNATNEMAVTLSFRPMVQPKCDAKSPMNAVKTPMKKMEVEKQAQPPQRSVGGTMAKRSFQKMVRKCMT